MPDARVEAQGGRIRRAGACAAAVALFLVAIGIVAPAPTRGLLPLSVGAPELCAWLLALSLLTALVTFLDARRYAVARVGLALAAVTALLAASPLARFSAVAHRADMDMQAAFGRDYVAAVPDGIRQDMRARPLQIWDLFRGLPHDDVHVTTHVPVGSSGDAPLTMTIYRPHSRTGPSTDDRPLRAGDPALVQVHGGAWQHGDAGDEAEAARYFAARHYVVFAIEYRLAPRFRWPAQLDDVRAAIAWIRQYGGEHGADPSRLALVGRSAGAQLALVAAYAPDGTAPKAVVSYYGPTDLVEGYRQVPRPDPLNVRRLLEIYLGGTPDASPDAYRDASPITYATRPLPPTLLIYGGRDHIVLRRFGIALHERLRASGTQSVLIEIPWADHAFDAVPFGPSAQLALYYAERFLALALR